MKMSHDLATVVVALADLVEYEGNARRGRPDLIAESLTELGQYRAVVVNKGTKTGRPMEVIAGWHTCKGLMKVGETHVSVHLLDVDDQVARRINLIDNHANDLAVYDDAALVEQLKQLEGDYTATGYSNQDLAELLPVLEASGEPVDFVAAAGE